MTTQIIFLKLCKNELRDTDFSSVLAENNANKAWNSLKEILINVFNTHAPMISKRVKGKKSPWLDRDIKTEMNNRDKLYRKFRKSKSEVDFDTYKKQRNKVNVIVRKAKSSHYRNLLTESSHDPKRFWNTLKKIFPTKNVVSSAKSFPKDGSMTSCSLTIVSSFCEFFLQTSLDALSRNPC